MDRYSVVPGRVSPTHSVALRVSSPIGNIEKLRAVASARRSACPASTQREHTFFPWTLAPEPSPVLERKNLDVAWYARQFESMNRRGYGGLQDVEMDGVVHDIRGSVCLLNHDSTRPRAGCATRAD